MTETVMYGAQWNSGNNSYACSNTSDKVWLLSEQEVTKKDYGFSTSYSADDTARQKKTSEYSQCMGAYTYSGGSYDGNGYWWLRSPYYRNDDHARHVSCSGATYGSDDVFYTNYGVVPALQISL